MLRLKITTDKTFVMDEIKSCVKLDNKPDHIDYKYGYETEYNYFEIEINGEKKILAVSGKVELYEIPVTETIIEQWEVK